MAKQDQAYVDEKGRPRWRRNDQVAEYLKQLYDFLVIGGYEETHARRYPQLAYTISRHPGLIDQLHAEGRLAEIQGIGGVVAQIIGEFIETGSSGKMEEFAEHPQDRARIDRHPRPGRQNGAHPLRRARHRRPGGV